MKESLRWAYLTLLTIILPFIGLPIVLTYTLERAGKLKTSLLVFAVLFFVGLAVSLAGLNTFNVGRILGLYYGTSLLFALLLYWTAQRKAKRESS